MHPALRRWSAQRLVFLFPVLCLAASLGYFGETLWFQRKAEATEGVVVRIYEWDNDMPFGPPMVYSPVFRYTWHDGLPTEASTGQSFSHRFEEGERHTILFDPRVKRDVRLTWFEQLYALPAALLVIALVTLLPAWLSWAYAIRPRIRRERERRLFCLPSVE